MPHEPAEVTLCVAKMQPDAVSSVLRRDADVTPLDAAERQLEAVGAPLDLARRARHFFMWLCGATPPGCAAESCDAVLYGARRHDAAEMQLNADGAPLDESSCRMCLRCCLMRCAQDAMGWG